MSTIAMPPPEKPQDAPAPAPPVAESSIVIPASWDLYVKLEELFEDADVRPRLAFCDNLLEIMPPPSFDHEAPKGSIGRMIDQYCFERDLEFEVSGSLSHRDEAKKGGKEPDESYFIGREGGPGEVPDLLIEVKVTSGGIDRLKLWHKFEVPEVWIYEGGKLRLFEYRPDGYREIEESRVLPGIPVRDIEELASMRPTSAAIREFRKRLAERGGR